MNGQMKNYDAYIASLKSMEEPVFKLELPFRFSIRKDGAYAESKGVRISDLTREELESFVEPLDN